MKDQRNAMREVRSVQGSESPMRISVDNNLLQEMHWLAFQRLDNRVLVENVVEQGLGAFAAKNNVETIQAIIRPWLAVYIDRICQKQEGSHNLGESAKIIPLFNNRYPSLETAVSPLSVVREEKKSLGQESSPDWKPAA